MKQGGMCMKIISLEKEAFDQFAKTHKYRNFYQTSAYGELMKKEGFGINYLGFLNNSNELIGAALFLHKEIMLGFKYAYAPRGMLIDYTDSDFMQELTEKLQKLLFKQHFIYIKIDPPIHCSERKSDGEIISYNPEINNILEILKHAGFKHRGFNLYFETLKPRWNAIIKLTASNKRLFANFSKSVRNKIRKAERTGVEVYQGTREDIPIFFEFVKKKHKRSLAYYQNLYDTFGSEKAEVYFAKLNTEKYVIDAKQKYEQELNRNEELNEMMQTYRGKNVRSILNEKMESDRLLNKYKNEMVYATKLLQDHPEGITIGAMWIIKFDQTIHMLIEGYNKNFSRFNPNYLLKWALIQKYNNEHYLYFNLNGIVGEFKKENKYKGLNESKLGFSATAMEYIGEFDYIINETMYQLCRIAPIKKQIKHKVE